MAPPPVDPALCVRCKGGRALCGKPCYLMMDIQRRIPPVALKSADWFGPSPPAMFVGRHGYPDVRVGPLVAPRETPAERLTFLGDTRAWYGRGIEDLVAARTLLVNGHSQYSVHDARARDPGRVLQVAQELALADRATDTELRFARVPNRALVPQLGDMVPPMGPGVDTRRARLAENPHVPRAVDRLAADTDVKATVAILELARAGVAQDHATRLLSAGLLGTEDRRRLVPTRWAITATDDTLSRSLVTRVRALPVLDAYHYFEADYNGNHFQILLLPRPWGFDMQETWGAGSAWSPRWPPGGSPGEGSRAPLSGNAWAEESVSATDWEEHGGRSSYASNITGAYYAARLAVAEHLARLGRQATAVVVRTISDLYWAPLGVWLIRETMRDALARPATVINDLAAAIAHMDARARSPWRRHSHFLGARYQATLGEFGRG